MSITDLIQRTFIFLAVITSMGTLVHDTRLNKVAEVAVPVANLSTDLASNLESLSHGTAHTHVEKAALGQVADGVPRTQARDDHRRYAISQYLSRGNTPFGSAYLWPSV